MKRLYEALYPMVMFSFAKAALMASESSLVMVIHSSSESIQARKRNASVAPNVVSRA